MHSTPPEESIRHRAYLLWEAEGRPDGRDEYYWRLASSQLQTEAAAQAPDEAVGTRTANPRTGKKNAAQREVKSQSADETDGRAPAAKLQRSAGTPPGPASKKAASKKTKAPAKKAQKGTGLSKQVET
jgi:hypothetical protein